MVGSIPIERDSSRSHRADQKPCFLSVRTVGAVGLGWNGWWTNGRPGWTEYRPVDQHTCAYRQTLAVTMIVRYDSAEMELWSLCFVPRLDR